MTCIYGDRGCSGFDDDVYACSKHTGVYFTYIKMTKEKAIVFAREYLGDRKRQGTDETNPDDLYWIWKIATEYVLLDIIPHIYGEALD